MSVHWQAKRLGEIFEIARGGSPRPIENFITADEDGLNWIKIGDATGGGKYIKSTKEKIRREGLNKTRFVDAGDFLLTNSMSFGRPYILAINGCIHDGWLVLKAKDRSLIDENYFYHLLSSNEVYQTFASRAGGSTVKNLNTEIVGSVEVSLPPLEEQRRIAAILDEADALRRKRKRAFDLLGSLTQSIFQEMFGCGKYTEIELKDAVKTGTIVTYGIVQAGPEFENGVPYIRTSDLVNGSIAQSGLRHTDPIIATRFARSRVEAGEIVMSIRATVGTTAIVPPALHGANLTQGTARIAPGDMVLVEYLLAYLRSERIQMWLKAQVKGATFLEITLSRLRELPVAVPPTQLQREFAERIAAVRRALESTIAQNDILSGLFVSLQSRAFSGQL